MKRDNLLAVEILEALAFLVGDDMVLEPASRQIEREEDVEILE